MTISITDERDFVSDRAEIVINNAQDISIPSKDAEVSIYINDTLMGRYKITSVGLSSDNGFTLTIQCSGVDFKNKFKTKVFRKFTAEDNNNTLEAIIKTVSEANEYKYLISKTLKNEVVDDTVQNDETDLKFLHRIAKKYNASIKVNNNTVMLVERTKHDLPKIHISNEDIMHFTMSADNLYNFKSVSAQYKDIGVGGTKNITVGNEQPLFKIKTTYKSKDMATTVAKKKLEELSQRKYEINLRLEGNENIQAESIFNLSDLHELLNGDWSADTVSHSLSDSGFITSIKAVSV